MTGVVLLPSRVTGLAAISMSDGVTFIFGDVGSSNSSHVGSGVGLRLTVNLDDFGFFVAIHYF